MRVFMARISMSSMAAIITTQSLSSGCEKQRKSLPDRNTVEGGHAGEVPSRDAADASQLEKEYGGGHAAQQHDWHHKSAGNMLSHSSRRQVGLPTCWLRTVAMAATDQPGTFSARKESNKP